MYGIRFFFIPYFNYVNPVMQKLGKTESLDYFLLVFSTIMIAAAGNIINDYFDVKADRINKPEKVIIGKHIKQRWAIVWHWAFNFVAFSIACYLSLRHETFWYVFIHLFSINALWFYSMYFKRQFLIGNVLIALLTGLVPILSGIYFLDITKPYSAIQNDFWTIENTSWITGINLKIFFVLFFAFFAFALNFLREIVKDMEDVKGDLILRAKTLPIMLGIAKTRLICIALIGCYLVLPLPFIIEGISRYSYSFYANLAPALLIILALLIAAFLLIRSTEKSVLKSVDFLLKISMVIGTSLPFYWILIA
jgi:4-hydroxybenzoate polyprenyltransferase